MLRNFTVVNILGSIEATFLLTLILFIPGYVVGWLSNVLDFRKRRFAMQASLSTPLAVAVLPILIYLLGRFPKILWALLGASWLCFFFAVGPVLKRWLPVRNRRLPAALWAGGVFVLAWAIVAIASLVDLQFKHRLYFSSTAYDYSTRAAFTAAAMRAIPPVNPFFAGNPSVPLRYHHFWMLLCSLATHLGHVGPRDAAFGGTVWAGIALLSLVVISLKFFIRERDNFQRKALIGCGLLLVTGLDILPTIFLYLRFHLVTPDMESWNEPIISWADSLLFSPHHVMCLVACMVGLIALRQPVSTWYERAAAILIAGLAFASATGLSTLVTFTFVVFVVLWLPFAALRRWWDDVWGLSAAGALGLVVALPYLRTLVERAVDGSGGGGRFFTVSVRSFPLGLHLVSSMLHISSQQLPAPAVLLISLVLMPVNYFLELGFFLFIAALRIRKTPAPMSREEETGWMMLLTSFFIGSFLRSTTIGSNDLAWRCFLPVQLVLLLWAASMLDDWWHSWSVVTSRKKTAIVFAGVLAVIGGIGTCYQILMLRAYPILADEGHLGFVVPWLDQDHELGARTYALRSAYERLGTVLPPDAIVQYNPDAPAFIPHQLYSGHSAAMGLPLCGAVFGGDVSRCASRMESIVPLFEKPSQSESAALDIVCHDYGINVMLVDDNDPVWRLNDSWVWKRKPLLSSDHVRAFLCGGLDQGPLVSAR